MGKRIQVTPGDRYKRLTVISEADSRRAPCGSLARHVLCKCDCGHETTVDLHALRSGRTASCGACRSKRGWSGSKIYQIWQQMLQRCFNPRNRVYARYGGRGITVCHRWRESFEAFLEDMGERPSPDYSIDRYPDFNGSYSPENCRWATTREQNRNTRTNRRIAFRGEIKCLSEWAEIFEINWYTLNSRLKRGLTIEEALALPLGQRSVTDEANLD